MSLRIGKEIASGAPTMKGPFFCCASENKLRRLHGQALVVVARRQTSCVGRIDDEGPLLFSSANNCVLRRLRQHQQGPCFPGHRRTSCVVRFDVDRGIFFPESVTSCVSCISNSKAPFVVSSATNCIGCRLHRRRASFVLETNCIGRRLHGVASLCFPSRRRADKVAEPRSAWLSTLHARPSWDSNKGRTSTIDLNVDRSTDGGEYKIPTIEGQQLERAPIIYSS